MHCSVTTVTQDCSYRSMQLNTTYTSRATQCISFQRIHSHCNLTDFSSSQGHYCWTLEYRNVPRLLDLKYIWSKSWLACKVQRFWVCKLDRLHTTGACCCIELRELRWITWVALCELHWVALSCVSCVELRELRWIAPIAFSSWTIM